MQGTVLQLGRVITVVVAATSVAACTTQRVPEEAARGAAMASVAKAVPPEVVQPSTAAPLEATIAPVAELAPTMAPVAATSAAEAAAQTTAPSRLAPFDQALAGQLQGVLDATVAEGQTPGALLAVGLRGQELWAGASGLADRQQGTPMQPTTPFRIGSLSKLFAAVVALQLVEEGKLQLDAPVATYLPGVVPDAEVITIRQLMNHTSGLYDYQDNRFITLVARDPGRVWAPEELIGYAVERGAYFPPGARWFYSNTNYVVLGLVVQQVTGRSLAQEIRARVIDPLALQHTVFTPDEAAPNDIARGYAGASDWSTMHPSHVWATASIVSTVQDLERFAQALFHEKLLTPASLNEMYGFVNANQSFGMPYLEYGLGLMRNPLAVGPGPDEQARPVELSNALGHIGGVSGYRAALWYIPASETVIVAAFNEATIDPVQLPTAALDVVLASQGR